VDEWQYGMSDLPRSIFPRSCDDVLAQHLHQVLNSINLTLYPLRNLLSTMFSDAGTSSLDYTYRKADFVVNTLELILLVWCHHVVSFKSFDSSEKNSSMGMEVLHIPPVVSEHTKTQHLQRILCLRY
jgi:hypothetical protein